MSTIRRRVLDEREKWLVDVKEDKSGLRILGVELLEA